MADRVKGVTVQPAQSTGLSTPVSQPSVGRKRGKTPLTQEQRDARKAQLAAEPHDARFRRLAIYRVPRACKAIAALGHLANRSSYSYTQEQVNKILSALEKSVEMVRNKFSGNKDNGETFSL